MTSVSKSLCAILELRFTDTFIRMLFKNMIATYFRKININLFKKFIFSSCSLFRLYLSLDPLRTLQVRLWD
jgi:hypothetical protein